MNDNLNIVNQEFLPNFEIKEIFKTIQEPINPITYEHFMEPELYGALKFSDLREYIINSSRFEDLITDNNLYGGLIRAKDSFRADGIHRRSETGPLINLDYIKEKGIDISKVLFFRRTQPAKDGETKPEYYWTTDFHGVNRGLTQELTTEERKSSIILISSLETISMNGGLIRDDNDDNGLAVRQINADPFNQKKALAIVKPYA